MNNLLDASTNKNAEHCVEMALAHGIYTMIITAQNTSDGAVVRMKRATAISIKRRNAENILAVTTRKCRSTITPRNRGVCLIVYDKTRPNPYLRYKFLDRTIIVRDNRRELEQTVQLIYDAISHRKDLKDLLLHTCVTQQHGKRRYLIIMSRGTDKCQRSVFKNGKKVPLHPYNKHMDELASPLYDRYMRRMLNRFGNTVADPRFIRKYGVKKTERILTDWLGEHVFLRKCDDFTGVYYIAETYSFRRHNE